MSRARSRSLDVLLLVSAFNGLTQRIWCELRSAGHRVAVELADGPSPMTETARERQPDLILCPYLKERVPREIWSRWPTIIIHPGPVGDRGPSSLDYAILDSEPTWGVTALQAIEEMDAGPVWASRTFAMPTTPVRKSALYIGQVADAAMECVAEVMAKAADPAYRPTPQQAARREVASARPRPLLRQADRWLRWDADTAAIIRAVRAADGAPGAPCTLAGQPCYAYDAHPGPRTGLRPGQIGYRRHGAVLVGTGDGSIWLGHLRRQPAGGPPTVKLPATLALGAVAADFPEAPQADDSYRQIRYQRSGDVGYLTFDFYNGAMSTEQGYRLAAALLRAIGQDTRVLVLRGSPEFFCNGIHLGVIEAADDPAAQAWENVRAINEVCREIVKCERQVIIAAYTGNAGAGGAMLGLGADLVVARDGIVLNPHYDIGVRGSELHSYTLPWRVGAQTARHLLEARLPVNAAQARDLGLVDDVGPRDEQSFGAWLADLAKGYTDADRHRAALRARARRLENATWPADEHRELAEMAQDTFDDRDGFAAKRRAFVYKIRPERAPDRLRSWR